MVIILHEVVVPLQLHTPAGQLACCDSAFLALIEINFPSSAWIECAHVIYSIRFCHY